MKRLLYQMISAGVGLWLATIFVTGVTVTAYSGSNFYGINLSETWKLFILLGIILGLLNYFVKPILNVITLPLRIITLGLFGFAVNMFLIWVVDYIFTEFSAPFLHPLLWTTLIIWVLNIVFSKIFIKETN
ncbi:MAG: hypothetical protein EXS48_01700 [Candidatus Staskawiczbacteria bacterium]|nr:hypothetical protein [Candidatus Staskawiczbacteria bacterium]